MNQPEKPPDLQRCEEFLLIILDLFDAETSDKVWEKCDRHEWHAWRWDAQEGQMVLRDSENVQIE
jgi:hypothetical protein